MSSNYSAFTTECSSTENGKSIFPAVQENTKFCLLTLSAKPQASALLAAQLDDPNLLNDKARQYTISYEEFKCINPNTFNGPTLSSFKHAELIKKIHKGMPIFIKEGSSASNPWNIKVSRVFDMTTDARFFRILEQLIEEKWQLNGNIFEKQAEKEKYLPLYESKLVDQFNHRSATFDDIPLPNFLKYMPEITYYNSKIRILQFFLVTGFLKLNLEQECLRKFYGQSVFVMQ